MTHYKLLVHRFIEVGYYATCILYYFTHVSMILEIVWCGFSECTISSYNAMEQRWVASLSKRVIHLEGNSYTCTSTHICCLFSNILKHIFPQSWKTLRQRIIVAEDNYFINKVSYVLRSWKLNMQHILIHIHCKLDLNFFIWLLLPFL